MAKKIYLDNNATTQVDPQVINAMLPFFSDFYENPGSSHLAGIAVQDFVEQAQFSIADSIGAKSSEIIFTSGATEAINLALRGVQHSSKNHYISLATEHKAVMDTVQDIEKFGKSIQILPVHEDGLLDIDFLEKILTQNTAMVCVMLANNETGVIQDIRKISEIVHPSGALLFCDATQAVGKIQVNVKELGIDIMAFSAHKFHGPKGIGALYISSSLKKNTAAQITGGGQQNNLRSGTLNVPGIIGMAKALEIAVEKMSENEKYIGQLRDFLENELLKIPDTKINGSTVQRLYNTTNLQFTKILSEELIIKLKTISVSSGAACSAVTSQPSHVLKAMNCTDVQALSSIRFSLSKFNTMDEIKITAEKIREILSAV